MEKLTNHACMPVNTRLTCFPIYYAAELLSPLLRKKTDLSWYQASDSWSNEDDNSFRTFATLNRTRKTHQHQLHKIWQYQTDIQINQ